MKLREIHHVGGTFSEVVSDYTDEQIEQMRQSLISTKKESFPLEGGKYTLLVTSDTFALFREEKLLGWVKLDEVTVDGKDYHEVVLFYLVKEARMTRALPVLLFAVRHYLDGKILVDGEIFSGGLALLRGLIKRKAVSARILNTITGDFSELGDEIPNEDHLAVVLESSHYPWQDYTIDKRTPKIYSPLLFEENIDEV